jgi:hypothetical protein
MTVIEVLVAVTVLWILPVWVCVAQGDVRNRNGWAWGLLLGWIGVLMIFLLPPLEPETEHGPRDRWEQFHEDVFGGR